MSPQLQQDGAGRISLALPTAICSLVSGGAVLALVLTAGASLGVPARRPAAPAAAADVPAPNGAAFTLPAAASTHAAAVVVVVPQPHPRSKDPVVVPAVDLQTPSPTGSSHRTSSASTRTAPTHRTPASHPAGTTMPVEAGSTDGGGLTWTPVPTPTEEPTSGTSPTPSRRVKPSSTPSIPGQNSHGPISAHHRRTEPVVPMPSTHAPRPRPTGTVSVEPAPTGPASAGHGDVPGARGHRSGGRHSSSASQQQRPREGGDKGRHRGTGHTQQRRTPAPQAHLLDGGVLSA